jgi:hypothetical protein
MTPIERQVLSLADAMRDLAGTGSDDGWEVSPLKVDHNEFVPMGVRKFTVEHPTIGYIAVTVDGTPFDG